MGNFRPPSPKSRNGADPSISHTPDGDAAESKIQINVATKRATADAVALFSLVLRAILTMRSGTHYDSSGAESAMNDLPAQEEIAESEPAEAT